MYQCNDNSKQTKFKRYMIKNVNDNKMIILNENVTLMKMRRNIAKNLTKMC